MKNSLQPLVVRHLKYGWYSLAAFLTLGFALETLHGMKVGWYLDSGAETRRLMFTLAHAHGALLGLVHVAFAATLHLVAPLGCARPYRASWLLVSGSLLLPLGFFLGGLKVYGGDPGVLIALAPIGGLLLVASGVLIASCVGQVRLKEEELLETPPSKIPQSKAMQGGRKR